MQQHPFEKLPMILVSGQARSGTTILTKAIGAHAAVFSNQLESNYIRDLLNLLKTNLENPSRVKQMLGSREQFVSAFRTALYHVLYPHDHIPAEMPSAVSTFSSLHSNAADYLFGLFIDPWIVNIVRNGVEVVASRMRHSRIGQHSFDEHCHAWAAATQMVEWGRGNSRFIMVRHEDLCSRESAATLFSGLFAELSLAQSELPSQFVSENRVSLNPSDDVEFTERVNRWKEWDSAQRQQFESICGPAMNELGYQIPWLE